MTTIAPPKYIKRCMVCGWDFPARRSDARTCSNACRSRLKIWRKNNAKEARAAMRILFVLRCAIINGSDPSAAKWIAEIKRTLTEEIAILSSRGFAINLPLDLQLPPTKDCPSNEKQMRRLRPVLPSSETS